MGKHILVVDDNEEIRSLLQEVLESEAYIVDTSSDGHSALDKINRQQARYEAILLDLAMPGMNGLQLIQLLRQRQDGWLHSIIALSANHEALQLAASLGVCQSLAKPFDLDTLLTVVRCCERQRL